ncbi:GNAT family N-acetyltransferase [Aurantibacter sp.]|uniref:GNAT family N-acetyltransferase n=1 Tax=Aurantibacter sp. TaxID=2807103 RepID=UPI0035C7D3CE
MKFPTNYNCLIQNEFKALDHKIVPIRYEDRLDIMKWRNEQMYHLRQDKPLTEKSQDNYFNGIVAKLFDQEKPNQILFSYLKNGRCIGYGGLVHINWIDKNAEISFIMNTDLEENHFHFHWSTYLKMIESLAFEELGFHKLYVYAFDLRSHLYKVLLDSNYFRDAILKEHCSFDNKFIDVVIYSKLKS